ncbi:MAG TPA: DUF1579 domain-containing protein [Candidatus Krumholzibacteria bacterium]|nr:DUF1579 domain-containing protein [Candidatus Krumholzibacteria bacterium]
MKRWICTTLALASLFAIAAAAFAGDDKKAAMPAMDPAAEQAMMAAMMPGEHHEHIKKLVGNFNYTIKLWMDPSGPADESTGTRTAEMVMGGRYLEEKYTGTFMGMAFEGKGTLGYDNMGKQYVSTWIDNMSTGLLVAHGTCGDTGWDMSGESMDPTTGKMVTTRSHTSMPDKDTIVMEMFMPGPDGKEFKMMEITCKRAM